MQTFNLDLSKRIMPEMLFAKQRDVGSKICIKLTDNEEDYVVPDDVTWSVWYSGVSGEGNYDKIDGRNAVVVNGSTATVELIYQMLDNPGAGKMCLVMNSADGAQLGWWNIPYFVEAIPGANSKAAIAYYQAFLQAQAKAEAAAERSEAAAERSKAEADRAEAGAGGTIIVSIDEGDVATHTAAEIYDAMQNGKNVVFTQTPRLSENEFIPLKLSTPSKTVFSKPGYPTEFDIFNIEINAQGYVSYETSFSSKLVAQAVEKVEADIAPVSSLPQTLTDEQKAQARKNIGVIGDEILQTEYSPNLLDLDAISENSLLLATNGNVYSGGSYASYLTTAYIPCNPGDTIRHQFNYNANRYDNTEKPEYGKMHVVCGYDVNGTFVSGSGVESVTSYTVPSGVASIRISFSKTFINTGAYSENAIIIQDSASVLPFTEYGTIIAQTLKPEHMPAASTPLSFLPDEICVAVGRTIEIYNNQVCPLADRYHFRWVCNVGKALKRKFSITGTESLIGNYDLTLEIYDDTEAKVYAKTSTLRIVAQLSSAVSICTIGDSLTNDKYWMYEVRSLSNNKVSFVGTRGASDDIKHEGRSGFTSKQYLTATAYSYENEGVHPFWDAANECFSWEYYKTNSGINPTAVQIFLGTNDLFGVATAEEFTANIKTMVDSIRADDASIPILVVLTILPGNQNGLGVQQSVDGFASNKGKYKFGIDCKFVNAMQNLHTALKSYTNLYFVPLAECHDSEYNYGAVEASVNPRATQKEYMPIESVHPQQQGYEQMADIMYSVICAKLGS